MGYLGRRTKMGSTGSENPVTAGGWVVEFSPSDIGVKVACEVYHASVSGPQASTFQVWIGTTFYDHVPRGDINSWDPNQPMYITPGDSVYFYFDTASGSAPKVALFFREPLPI